MIIWKKCSLPTRAEKEAAAKKQQELEQRPETVTALKAAMAESCTERHGRNGGRSGASHHHVGTGCLRYGRHR